MSPGDVVIAQSDMPLLDSETGVSALELILVVGVKELSGVHSPFDLLVMNRAGAVGWIYSSLVASVPDDTSSAPVCTGNV